MPFPRSPFAPLAPLLLVAAIGAAPPASELQRLLSLPLSPGSVAALVAHVGDPAAQARLVEALRDPRPDVRATAARVAFVSRAGLVIPHVPRALDGEADDGAAAELVRIVASFDAEANLARLLAAAKAHGPEVQSALFESLGRNTPDLLARVVGEQTGADDLAASAIVLSSAQHPAARAALARAALLRGHLFWSAFLLRMHAEMVQVDADVLERALAAPDERVRTWAAYYVAVRAGRSNGIDRRAIAFAADGAAAAEGPATWEAAYRELARRALQRPAKTVDWRALLANEPPDERGSRFLDVNASLLGSDRQAVESILGGRLAGAEWYGSKAARDHPESRVQKTRTLAPAVSRLLPDLLAVFECRERGRSSFAAAEIFYGPDGRPRVVRPGEARLGEACTSVAHTAFLVTIASPTQPVLPQTSDGLYLPFTAEYLACVSQPREPVQTALDGPGRVLPRPREKLAPEYPKALKALRISGIVRAEAEITSRGCVRSVETVSSLDPLLDVETLRTVLAAPFEPMTVGGGPVASRVVLAVTFKP